MSRPHGLRLRSLEDTAVAPRQVALWGRRPLGARHGVPVVREAGLGAAVGGRLEGVVGAPVGRRARAAVLVPAGEELRPQPPAPRPAPVGLRGPPGPAPDAGVVDPAPRPAPEVPTGVATGRAAGRAPTEGVGSKPGVRRALGVRRPRRLPQWGAQVHLKGGGPVVGVGASEVRRPRRPPLRLVDGLPLLWERLLPLRRGLFCDVVPAADGPEPPAGGGAPGPEAPRL